MLENLKFIKYIIELRQHLSRTDPLKPNDPEHNTEVFSSSKGLRSKKFANFLQNAGDLKKKDLRSKIRKFSAKIKQKKRSLGIFLASSLACSKTKQQCLRPCQIRAFSRTRRFRGLARFEAKTFDAKDFTLRPPGLHL